MSKFLSIVFVIMIVCLSLSCQRNMICNGDFQNYSLTRSDYNKYQKCSVNYAYASNNSSCWYAKLKSFLQIKQFSISGKLTNVVDLISTYPYYACQNLLLIPNKAYQVKFNFIIDGDINYSVAHCLYNNVSIFNITSQSSITPQLGNFKFIPKIDANTLCFKADSKFKKGTSIFDIATYGPVLDNVSLSQIFISPTDLLAMTIINYDTANVTVIFDPLNTISNNTVVQQAVQQLVIELNSFWNQQSGLLYLYSNFKIIQHNLQLGLFDFCIVQLNGEVLQKTNFQIDKNGYLFIQTQPETLFSDNMAQKLRIYAPDEALQLANIHKIIFKVNGKQIQMDQISIRQRSTLQTIGPLMNKIAYIVKKSFAFLNVFYCSYFVLNVIQFWNLTLLYNFLAIESVPKFTQSFFSNMNNFFFSYNSFSMQISKAIKKESSYQPVIDFKQLNQQQKIVALKNNHIWFAFVGSSSNFMTNNFDSLILLSFFVLKCFLLKKFIKFLNKKLNKSIRITSEMFFHQFQKQILCFTPFILVSALQVFKFLGEYAILGKINNFLQIFVVFFIVSIVYLNIINIFIKHSKVKKNKQNQYKKLSQKQKLQQIIKILLNILIPTIVVFQTKEGFFVVITIVILLKFLVFLFHFKTENYFGKIIKSISNFSWIIFHLSYFIFFILEIILKKGIEVSASLKNILGFTVIFCLLVGGLFDICECIVSLCIFVYKGIIWVYHSCKKSKQILPKKMGYDETTLNVKVNNSHVTSEKCIQKKTKTINTQLPKNKSVFDNNSKTLMLIPIVKVKKGSSSNQIQTINLQTNQSKINAYSGNFK